MATKIKHRAPQTPTQQETRQTHGPATDPHPLAQAQDQVGNAELQRRLSEETDPRTPPPTVPDGMRSEQVLTQTVPAWDATGPQSCEQSPESLQVNAQRDIALKELGALESRARPLFWEFKCSGTRLGLSPSEVQGILSQQQAFAQYRKTLTEQPPSEFLSSGTLVQARLSLSAVDHQLSVLKESVAEEVVLRAETLRKTHYRWLYERCADPDLEQLERSVHKGMLYSNEVFLRVRGLLSPNLGPPDVSTLVDCMTDVERVAHRYNRHARRYSKHRHSEAQSADFYIEVADWVDWGAKLYLGKFAYVMCGGSALGEFCESATNVGTAALSTAADGYWNDRDIDETLLQTALAAAMAAVYEMVGGKLGKKLGGPLIDKLRDSGFLNQAVKKVTSIIAEALSKKVGDIPLTIGMTFLEALSQSKEGGSSDGQALQYAYAKTKQALSDYFSSRDVISTIAGQGAKKASGE